MIIIIKLIHMFTQTTVHTYVYQVHEYKNPSSTLVLSKLKR